MTDDMPGAGRDPLDEAASVQRGLRPWTLWLVNLGLLLSLIIWLALDPQMEPYAQDGLDLRIDSLLAPRVRDAWRSIALVSICLVAAGSWAVMIHGILRGPKSHRRLSGLLVAIGLLAGWLGLFKGASELTWRAQQVRVGRELSDLERLVEHLQDAWPEVGGRHSLLGSFTAYPPGAPQTLLLVTPWRLHHLKSSIATIERSTGELRFQLSPRNGVAYEDWIEWQREPHPPRSFTGGLGDAHQLARWKRLAKHWCLVRYEAVRPGGSVRQD